MAQPFCPSCSMGWEVYFNTTYEEIPPSKGDFNICLYCKKIFQMGANQEFEEVSEEEYKNFSPGLRFEFEMAFQEIDKMQQSLIQRGKM